jgi:hypothetical protein
VAIITAGVKRVSINSVGNVIFTNNVGIGTSSPAARLHMIGGTPIHAETNDPATGTRAILGWANSTTGATRGVYARSDSSAGTALFGWAPATTGFAFGVHGRADSTGFGYAGVAGELTGATGTGYALHGTQEPSGNSYAIYSLGRFAASGLFHYCAESPEPLNIYSGSARLDSDGQAVISLPNYFDAINAEPRIQLTAAGASMPGLFASEEFAGNTFQISGGRPGGKVYWEVKARRNDAWVRHYGAPIEQEKVEGERGLFQHPETLDLPVEAGVTYARRQMQEQANALPTPASHTPAIEE